jgi:hypothetical protein
LTYGAFHFQNFNFFQNFFFFIEFLFHVFIVFFMSFSSVFEFSWNLAFIHVFFNFIDHFYNI